jgi:cytochrome c peroxidase
MALAGLAVSATAEQSPAELSKWAAALFGGLPTEAASPVNPTTDSRVELGRVLYFDPRLSKNHDVACNSCHRLDRFGVDGEATSPGHRGQRGDRNSPSVLNAALHVAQFWDGRALDVEQQAKGPVLNPVEMAMTDAAAVEKVMLSIPGYAPLFQAAFPGQEAPVSFDNMALAIAAFERKLVTPAPLDAFLTGELEALDARQQRGLATFLDFGCTGCHMGPLLGAMGFQKLGVVNAYATDDQGRMGVTGEERDRHVFKVPSLRNVAKTGPYFHDGSIKTLKEVVRLMAHHQLGKQLEVTRLEEVVAFLESLTGSLDPELAAMPALPQSGPTTPAPDPS